MKLTIDFEVRSPADIKKVGAWKYAEHPETTPLCLAVKAKHNRTLWVNPVIQNPAFPDDSGFHWGYESEYIIRSIALANTIEAHNAEFERAIWRNIMVPRYGWPDIPDHKWRCSAAKAAAHALPRSLEGAGAALGLDIKKDMEGHRLMMKMCRPRKPRKGEPQGLYWHEDPEDFLKLFRYCLQDVEAEHAISEALDDLNPMEQKVWFLDQKMNERGIKADTESAAGIIRTLNKYEAKLTEELQGLTGGQIQGVKQVAKMAEFCGCESMTKECVAEALETETRPEVKRVLEIRQIIGRSSTSKFKAIIERACNDGRLRGNLMYHGATTGRWTAKGVQLQNLPRKPMKEDDFPLALKLFHDLDPYAIELLLSFNDPVELAQALIRPMLTAEEGKEFIGYDFSGIEARVVLWYADEQEALQMFRTGADIYCDMATTIYDRIITKADKIERQVGKTCIAEGSIVLTDKGLIPIEKITLAHRLWDGVEWVCHKGIIYQGEKEVITYDGLTATEDHAVFTKQGPIPFGAAASQMERLICSGANGQALWIDRDCGPHYPSPQRVPLCESFLSRNRSNEADGSPEFTNQGYYLFHQKRQTPNSSRGGFRREVRRYNSSMSQSDESQIPTIWRPRYRVPVHYPHGIYSLGFSKSPALRLSGKRDRQDRQQWALRTRQPSISFEERTNKQSREYSLDFLGGTENSNRGFSQSFCLCADLSAGQKENDGGRNYSGRLEIRAREKKELERNKRKVRVYDVLNAGPRHRFTVSNKLVHNCILGSGFGMGPPKFQLTCKTQAGVEIDKKMSRKVIKTYRKKYDGVPAFWYGTEGAAIQAVKTGEPVPFGRATWLINGHFLQCVLPSGRRLSYPYPSLKIEPSYIFPCQDDEGEKSNIMIVGGARTAALSKAYKQARTEELQIIGDPIEREKAILGFTAVVAGQWKKEVTYGGKLVENIVQATARDLLVEAMLRLEAAGYPQVLSVHDETIAEIPLGFGSEEEFEQIMIELPSWAEGCPVAAEGWRGRRYRK